MAINPRFTTSTQDNQTTSSPADPVQDLAQSKYDFKYMVFPEDLGMDYNGHYMVININVPTKIDRKTAAGNFTDFFTPLEPIQRSKVDTLRYGGGLLSGIGSGDVPLAGIPRFTRRITESIALFMPTPLVYNQHNIYEEVSLTALAGKMGVGVLNGIGGFAEAFVRSQSNSLARSIAGGLKKLFSETGQLAGQVSSVMQNPINPAVEVVFSNTAQRQFTFELLMAPRNERESYAIKNIVRTLKFHASPEINNSLSGGYVGLTWIPPADFDITFFNKGVENTNILRINTCVLERIEVDYAPAGGTYSTFRNGHPVAVRLSLGFRELEPMHKQRVLQGF